MIIFKTGKGFSHQLGLLRGQLRLPRGVADFTGYKLPPKKLCSQHKLSFHCHSCLLGTMKTVPQVQGSSTVFQQ